MNRNVFLWGLYDFANSLLMASLTLYFSQWVIIENKFDDIWYSGTFALATALLLFTSPFWGTWSDKLGKRMPFISWATLVMIFAGGALAFVATSAFPTVSKVITALVLFLILQYFFQFSLIFHDILVAKLSTPKTRGKISGIGEAFNEFGWLVGPAILLPFAGGAIILIGDPGRAQVFLPAAFFFTVFALPMILWFKEPKEAENVSKGGIYQATLEGLKHLIQKDRNVALFLVAFMFISDAILTAELYFAVFFDQVYKIPDAQKVLFLVIMQIFAVVGAFVIGKINDIYGSKRILFFVCLDLILTISILALNSSVSVLYLLATLAGIGWGGFYATSRILMIKISPPAKLGGYFGFYATFQRFASIIGPLVFGGVTLVLRDYGATKYRIAGLALIVLMIIGTLLLTRVEERPAAA